MAYRTEILPMVKCPFYRQDYLQDNLPVFLYTVGVDFSDFNFFFALQK